MGYEPRRKKKEGNLRARHAARQRSQRPLDIDRLVPERLKNARIGWLQTARDFIGMLLRDAGWYLRNHPIIWQGIALIVVLVGLLYFLSYLFSGNILPRVKAIGVNLGGMSVSEAELALRDAWRDTMSLDIIANGEVIASTDPERLGVQFDAQQTARNAKAVGLRAVPFGRTIEPVVTVDRLTAQNYLLDLANHIDRIPVSAHYEWQNGELVGIEGQDGYRLDTSLTIETLTQHAPTILNKGRLDLLMITHAPEAQNPNPYIDAVRLLTSQPIQISAYDPYTNQHFTWIIAPEEFTRWLSAGTTSLTLREDAFLPHLELLNTTLNDSGKPLRFLAPTETTNALRDAISIGQAQVNLRVRYHPTLYTIVQGDTSYRISRKTGIPQILIVEANQGRNLEELSIGDTINIPSRDVTMPESPIPNKRIIVDLEAQHLIAFENSEVRFSWPISSGVSNAYTAPGIYQILSHKPMAYGSSNILCSNAGIQCGQWEMSWFMGIYEIRPGLVNGFHGKVLLPNGNYLGDGMIGSPVTFGCIMSGENEAQLLYEWAEIGTVVEIISPEYAPMSDLGQLALNLIQSGSVETSSGT